jgi:hypothetical protein
MSIRRWTNKILVALFVLVIISSGVFTGCGKKTVLPPVFSVIDEQILKSAAARYKASRASLSPEAARGLLVNNLNSQDGVAKATLGIDKYTIFIDYKDGDSAAVITRESEEEQTPETSYSPNTGLSNRLHVGASPISLVSNFLDSVKNSFTVAAAPTGPGIPITARSKKVLILSPISDLKAPRACQEFFLQMGWNPADITFKMSTGYSDNTIPAEDKGLAITGQGPVYGINPGALLVKPEDFFNLGEYGVIIINAHGAYSSNFDADNSWLQCGQITKEALASNNGKNDYARWKRDGKLMIAFCSQTAMSDDAYQVILRGNLLREKMSTLASPYVEMATCFGYGFNSIFIDKGAQRFLSWDNTVFNEQADPNQVKMIEHMVGGKSVEEAYQADNIMIRYTRATGMFGTTYDDKGLLIVPGTPNISDEPITPVVNYSLRSYAPATSFYLPAWIKVKITGSKQLAGIKEGVTTLGVEAHNESSGGSAGGGLVLTYGQTEAELTIEQGYGFGDEYILAQILDDAHKSGNLLIPGHYRISVGGYNDYWFGEALSGGSIEVDVHCGLNIVEIELTDLIWIGELSPPPGWKGVEYTPPATTTPTGTPTTTPTTRPTTTPTTAATTVPTTQPPQTRPKELSNDDGDEEGWVSLGGKSNWGFLVRFAASPSFSVTKIRILNKIKGTPIAGSRFTVRITDKDLIPKWELSLPMTSFAADPSWLEIQVPNLTVNDAFCVLVNAPSLGQGLGPYIGVDESGPNLGSETLSGWQIVPWVAAPAKETSNWMIRAVGLEMTP